MKYSISRLILGGANEIPITEDEFIGLKTARDKLNSGLEIEENYDLALGNYEDFEKEIVNASIESMLSRPKKYSDFHYNISRFNKRLINILTSTRLYVDHVKRNISDIIPETSEGIDKIKKLFAERYDKNKEYRFMEALRNYVQHRGFPVHETSMQSWLTSIDDPERMLLYTIDLISEKKRLFEDKKFKKSVLEEFGEKIDLKHTTRKYIEGLSEIHTQVRVIISDYMVNARNMIEGYIKEYKEKFDERIVGLTAVASDDNGKKEDEISLLLEWDDIRLDLSDKNRTLTNLSRRYVIGGSRNE